MQIEYAQTCSGVGEIVHRNTADRCRHPGNVLQHISCDEQDPGKETSTLAGAVGSDDFGLHNMDDHTGLLPLQEAARNVGKITGVTGKPPE